MPAPADALLGATLVQAEPPPTARAAHSDRPPPLDALLEGGFPRGQLAELVGPRTSGRTRVLLGAIAGAMGGGGWAALVDGTDSLDPAAAAALGVPVGRLLWIRCGGQPAVAWQAADVLVQSGGFDLVAVDLGDLPPWILGRTPLAVYVRLQRAVERAATALVVRGRGAWPEAWPRSRWRWRRAPSTGRPGARGSSRGSRPRRA